MSSLLANLCTVPGVTGAALFEHSGACLEHRLEDQYDPEGVRDVLDELLVGLEVYEYLDRASFRFGMATFATAVLGVMRTARYRAIAIATPAVNPALLTVAFGALEVKLGRLEAPSTPTSASLSPPSRSVSVDVRELERLPPAELVSAMTIRATQDALADCLGPMARVLVREHLSALGLPESIVPKSLWPTLIENLAKEIPDEGSRRRFIAETVRLA